MVLNYELIVRAGDGSVQTLQLRAADAAMARAAAVDKGMQVLGCTSHGGGAAERWRLASTARLRIDVANFSYELALLISAGLSMIDALRALAAKEKAADPKTAILDLATSVSEGLPLSAALERQAGRFPALLIATVSASEQTGDLSLSLRKYAEHQQTLKAVRDKVVGSAVYPMLLLAVGSVVILFLITIVVPKFAVLIETTRRELPWSSRLLMSWGHLVAQHVWEVAIAGLALVVFFFVAAKSILRDGAKSAWMDRVPVIGSTLRQFRHAQLYRTTGMLVRGGIAAPRALQLSMSLLGQSDRPRLAQAIRLIQEGRSLSAALQAAELADPVASSMLAVAERTGALAEILERIAQFYESQLQRSVDLTIRLFEPLLMIVIGLIVGGIVVLMYLPIFDLASSLQ